MIINETDLKQIYQGSIASRECRHGRDCPSPDELLSFFDLQVHRKTKFKIIDHVSHCPICLREFRFLTELQRQEEGLLRGEFSPLEGKPVYTSGRPAPLGSALGLSSAFLGIVLALVSLLIILTDHGGVDSTRGGRSVLSAVRPVGIQPVVEPLVFEWQGTEQVDSYIVEIYDDSLFRLWVSLRTSSKRLYVPRAGPPRLELDRIYYWVVIGYSGDAHVIESPLAEFRLIAQQKRYQFGSAGGKAREPGYPASTKPAQ